jgi:hypothetical protein
MQNPVRQWFSSLQSKLRFVRRTQQQPTFDTFGFLIDDRNSLVARHEIFTVTSGNR